MKVLRRTQFGNPILRQTAQTICKKEILSPKMQAFIKDLYYTLEKREYGVGLAAPQVGKSIAICVIGTKPTPTRPDIQKQKLTLINPVIIKKSGAKKGLWEACVSFGSNHDYPYAQAVRYEKVSVKWQDEKAEPHQAEFDGFIAHVIQHEVDHLNGILFVDRVVDTKTYMTASEYKKMRKNEIKEKK